MGSGNTKHYTFGFMDEEEADSEKSVTVTEQIKHPMLKKNNSHPDLLTTTTVFCPYLNLKLGKKVETAAVVQRRVTKQKSSLIGGGKLN